MALRVCPQMKALIILFSLLALVLPVCCFQDKCSCWIALPPVRQGALLGNKMQSSKTLRGSRSVSKISCISGPPSQPKSWTISNARTVDTQRAIRSCLQGTAAVSGLKAISLISQCSHAETWIAAMGALLWAAVASIFSMIAFLNTPMDPVRGSGLQPPFSRNDATLSETKEGWLLCEPSFEIASTTEADTLFIFYCGAKLDPTHYRGLAIEIAKLGVSTLIVQSPLNIPALPTSHPHSVIKRMSGRFSRFVLGGHSFGAVRAARFAKELCKDGIVSGLLVMGFSANGVVEHDLSSLSGPQGATFPVGCVWASRDGFYARVVARHFKGDEARYMARTQSLLPAGAFVRRIAGGTHFGFADLSFAVADGFPFPDLEREIPRSEQHRQTALALADVLAAAKSTTS